MSWVLTAILCIILIEIVVRIPLRAIVSEIRVVVLKSLRVISSESVSDHWKEKVMLTYARSLFAATLKLAGAMVAVGAAAFLVIRVFQYLGSDILNFVVSWVGIFYSIIVATVYFKVRSIFV